MSLAPVVLFVYNRPWHTEQTLKALANNFLAPQSDLIIFSDAAKDEAAKEKVEEVRQVINSFAGFKSKTIIQRQENWGLSKSVIQGVGEVVNKYGKIIVLEDDHVTSPYFLQYMNQGLTLYQDEPEVISLHGYMYPVKADLPDTFFIKGADCWGWATWKRGWDLFEEDGSKLLKDLKDQKLTTTFDFNNSYPYTRMLQSQIAGKNNSWAVRWYASAFLKDKLTLYPGKSLIHNIGNDDSGTHALTDKKYNTDINQSPVNLEKIAISEHLPARKAIEEFFQSDNKYPLARIVEKIKGIF